MGIYDTMNLLVRRNPEENNFKAILETIRDLLNTPAVIHGRALPSWLQDLVLGYGNPSAASFRSLEQTKQIEAVGVTYADTFLDVKHIVESFPTATVEIKGVDGAVTSSVMSTSSSAGPSAEVAETAAPVSSKGKKSKSVASKKDIVSSPPVTSTLANVTLPDIKPPYHLSFTTDSTSGKEVISVSSLPKPNPGPYPEDVPPSNPVRFTPVQVHAIRSGINQGLTMIVGPPGTGKTDVAVQIIAELYKNYPTQKILLVTHSNAALNDLFEKILQVLLNHKLLSEV